MARSIQAGGKSGRGVGAASQATAGETRGADRLVAAWGAAWNTHDMAAAAALVAIDVDFVTVAGRWLRGRREFRQHHRDIHERHMRATTWTTLAWDARRVGRGLVLAHVEWAIAGEPPPLGRPQPRTGIFTWLLARSGGEWIIAAAHNTNLRADTRHRLAGRTFP